MGYAQLLEVTGRVNDFLNAAISPELGCAHDDAARRRRNARSKQVGDPVGGRAQSSVFGRNEAARWKGPRRKPTTCPRATSKRVIAQHVREAIEYHERIPTSVLRRKDGTGRRRA